MNIDDTTIKFECELEEFIKEYKEYNRKNNKMGNVQMHKYEDVPKIFEEARTKWRSNMDIYRHKDHIDILREIRETIKD
jgi:hypothetical protein